ncbi:MAG: hypothetical protein SOZ34_11940 [Clostridia bacterium]|nr:hypothetical protein [Clostridia bacterium]
MKLNISKLKSLDKKRLLIAGGSIAALAVLITVVTICMREPKSDEMVYEDLSDIEVTDEEMGEYRNMIGSDMDIKKVVFILFESEEECRSFIETHGADEYPEQAGSGIVPLMEDGYYNIVGKISLEEIFDSLADGDYAKEPVLYSNMFCYLKRIGIDSPINNNDELKTIIQNDKMQKERKAGE